MTIPSNPDCLVVYAWDGRGEPLAPVRQDEPPAFAVLIFDYTGACGVTEAGGWPVLSCATECKGEIYREVHRHLAASVTVPECATLPEYVALIDDDIELAWSDLNRLLAIAAAHGLDSFQAALTPDSYHDHERLLARVRTTTPRALPWVEVMMPFYRTDLFMAGRAFYERSISSYGLDQFVMPALQKLLGLEQVAVIDAVALRHTRPITSDGKVFANGLTARQERDRQRRMARDLIIRERPDLIGTAWYLRTFAPLDGPARYWGPRLAAPWLWLRGVLARRRLHLPRPS